MMAIQNIYRTPSSQQQQQQQTHFKKLTKDLNRCFSEEDTQMANKQMKRSSMRLVVGKM